MLEELATYGHNAITRMHNRQRNDAGDKRLDLLKKHADELQDEIEEVPFEVLPEQEDLPF